MKHKITLTEDQIDKAMREGAQRQARKTVERTINGGPSKGERAKRNHQLGALGEMANGVYLRITKHLDFGTPLQNDMPDYRNLKIPIDVKTRWGHKSMLIVTHKGKSGRAYVLATTEDWRTFILHGWAWGSEIMQDQYWTTPNERSPAYFFPQRNLRPMEELVELLVGERQLDLLA